MSLKKNEKTEKRVPKEKTMESKSVYLPVSYWRQLEEIRKTDKTRTNTKVIREAVARVLSGEEEEDVKPKTLPLRMLIPCGEPQSLSSLTQPFEDATVKIKGPLLSLVTPNSFVGIAQGNSNEHSGIDSISNGDRLLMIPKEDFKKEITPGMLVLTQINYKHGDEPRVTLKKYAEFGKLKANNPKSKAPVPDGETESFEALAICAGVLEKNFI